MAETTNMADNNQNGRLIQVGAGAVSLAGLLHLPTSAHGIVILTHGIEGSVDGSHQTALTIAQVLFQDGIATLLVDLFTSEEQQLDVGTDYFRLNTSIMEQRIASMAQWLLENEETQHLSVGYFGAGATGAAVLIAAAERPDVVTAVVSAGGYIDQAQDYIQRILAPTLLIASQQNTQAITQNQSALEKFPNEKRFEQVEGGASLFETKESVVKVAQLVSKWFNTHLVTIA
ncbi:MAG: hypothetical protein NVS4B12_04460 [Ktedonobacteraceae bacterium]